MNHIDKIVELSGFKISDSFILQHLFDATVEDVKRYCRIKTIPCNLWLIIYDIVIELYFEKQKETSQSEEKISSISQGERTVSFQKVDIKIRTNEEIFNSYKNKLNRYRKLGF